MESLDLHRTLCNSIIADLKFYDLPFHIPFTKQDPLEGHLAGVHDGPSN